MKFNSTRNKINTIWEDSQTNTENVEKISVVNKDFNSFNFGKRARKITLVDNQEYIADSTIHTITKQIENINERFIPSINVVLKPSFNTGYVLEQIDYQYLDIYVKYNIKMDNVWVDYNFTKIDENIYNLDIQYKAFAQLFNEHPLGFFYTNIPVYITIDLYFMNSINYFTTQTEGE